MNINENAYNFSNDFIGMFELSKFYESVDMKMNKKILPLLVLATLSAGNVWAADLIYRVNDSTTNAYNMKAYDNIKISASTSTPAIRTYTARSSATGVIDLTATGNVTLTGATTGEAVSPIWNQNGSISVVADGDMSIKATSSISSIAGTGTVNLSTGSSDGTGIHVGTMAGTNNYVMDLYTVGNASQSDVN